MRGILSHQLETPRGSRIIASHPQVLLLALFLLSHTHTFAQSPWGSILGSVCDSDTSQGIADVQISLGSSDNRPVARLTTNGSGDFMIRGVPSGEYEMVLRKTGYPVYSVRSIRVQNGSDSLVSLKLRKKHGAAPESATLVWQGHPVNRWGSDWGSTFEQDRLARLPSPRNIWAILENQEVSSVTNRVDEGGIGTGIVALVGSGGRSWTENGYRFDGIEVTDPYTPGKPLIYPAFGDIQEFQVVSGLHSARDRVPGAECRLASRAGGSRLHSQLEGYYLGPPFQSSNLDDRLRSFGYQTTDHFERFPEAALSTGGPVPHTAKAFFFSSFGFQRLSKVVRDFSAVPKTTVISGLTRFDADLGAHELITATLSGQIVQNSHLGAGPGISPSATLQANDRFELIQTHWTHRRNPQSVLHLHFGFSHSSPTDTLHAGIDEPNRTQLFTGEMTGAAPLESDSALSRFSIAGEGQSWRQFGTGKWQNRLDYGIDLEESVTTEELRVYHGLRMLFFPALVPREVVQFNSPSHTKQRLRELSFFLDDQLSLKGKLFLHLGLNLDASKTFLPPQQSGAGVYVPARTFAGATDVISWTTLSPRAGIALPIAHKAGNLRFAAGFSRYCHILPSSYANFANPTSLGGQIAAWDDRNHDGMFQPGEEAGLLGVFGGPYSSVDPQIRRPFSDEWGISLQQDPCSGCALGIRLFHRQERRLIDLVNIGVPLSSYVPAKIADPGDDGISGTRDDRIITVYNQDPATLGKDRFLLTNPGGFKTRSEGLELTLRSSFMESAFVELAFTAVRSVGAGSPGNTEYDNDTGVIGSLYLDPNSSLNSTGRLFFDRAYTGNIAAYLPGPFGIHFGSVIKYLDGLPFGRRLIVPDLNQGPIFVMASPRGQPGGFRTQFNLTFDQRIARDFQFRHYRLSCLLDIFDLLNLNKNLREYDITGTLFGLRTPLQVQNPRVIRIGVSLSR